MLSISLSAVKNNTTLCETGLSRAAVVAEKHGLKPGEPIPLIMAAEISAVPDILWCLRAVKDSQKQEATRVAWQFVLHTLERMGHINADLRSWIVGASYGRLHKTEQRRLKELMDRYFYVASTIHDEIKYGAWRTCVSDIEPSQIAIDVGDFGVRFAKLRGEGRGEELQQQADLKSLLMGKQ